MKIKPPNYFIIFLSFLMLVSCAINPTQSQPIKAPTARIVPCYKDAAYQLLRWDKVKGKELNGLKKRREEEMNLFLKGCKS